MSKVDAGSQAFHFTAQVEQFLQIAKLADFSHQFRPQQDDIFSDA